MTRARIQLRELSARRKVWWFLVHVPAILMFTIIAVWGLDFVIRFGANWAALVWLVIASPMWAFLAAVFVIPAILAVQYFAERLTLSGVSSVMAQVVVVACLGAFFAATTGAMSIVAGALGGAIAAALIAVLPVLDPKQRFVLANNALEADREA
jgi:hypothetical protein